MAYSGRGAARSRAGRADELCLVDDPRCLYVVAEGVPERPLGRGRRRWR